MALTPGTRLGVYEVITPIGAGGMGEVYRATDTTLSRQVAIKILPDAFASDPERLARFEREAKTLASLNHPNISAIYGFEKSGGTHALVMELVEGDNLSQRIAKGAIPLDEALPLAKQIADALAAAHDKGIVHRDLKPANIALTAHDQVKVLDFGLAKAMESGAGSWEPGTGGLANSPTHTSPAAMTQPGLILGTAAYMSPEQAKGRVADKRTDVWAFGCVLYEMLTGRTAFQGEDVLDTVTAVMRGEPDWSALPAGTPAYLRTLIEKCLKKDRKERIADIAVAQFLLDSRFAPTSGEAGMSRSPAARVLPWALFAAASAVLVAMLVMRPPSRAPRPSPPRTAVVLTGTAATLRTDPGASNIALSPDGTALAFVAQEAGDRRVFVRKLDQLQATPLAGTENANSPFFSPDGQWIAFIETGV